MLWLIVSLFLVGLVGSTLVNTDQRVIRTNAKTLQLQIEACTATMPSMTIPDANALRQYLAENKIVLKSVNGHTPTIYAARDTDGNDIVVGPDANDPAYGDFVLARPTASSYELRYVGKDLLTYPAFLQ